MRGKNGDDQSRRTPEAPAAGAAPPSGVPWPRPVIGGVKTRSAAAPSRGHVAGRPASAMGRATSNSRPQALQRNPYRGMADGPAPESPAPRLAVVVHPEVPPGTHELCRELAQALAAGAGEPVALIAGIPGAPSGAARPSVAPPAGADPGRAGRLGERERDVTRAIEILRPPAPPTPMGAAPFVWREDGRPDWGAMWTTFCELALYGGPPHRGPDAALRAADDPADGRPLRADLLAELRRGIWETTGLHAEAEGPRWLAITCDSPRMAAWLCAVVILENVDARVDGERLLLPLRPEFELHDQIRSLVTVVAKTHHYWQAHLVGSAPGA